MKALLLSVALLLTGAQANYLWQQDEPQEEQTVDKKIETFMHDTIGIVSDVVKSLDYGKIAEQYQIKEKLEAARKNAKKLEKAVEGYYDEVYKKVDEKLDENFPVFKKHVVPALKEFDDALETHIKNMVKETVPVVSDFLSGLSKQAISFFENAENVAAKGRDALRAEIDNLRVKLQPYADEVHKEYERYRKDLQGELQKDMKELKHDVEKNVEKIKEHAQPHLDTLRSKFSDGKELQEEVEKLFQQIKDAFKDIE
ncbi:apolipoprotein A-I-like [Eleutherodactylus coqui]|uniref:apolipoprotein A-I-like n=1 Tax=Eleutherodactylus coqui TaxID=57060 RepID=UPI003462D46D